MNKTVFKNLTCDCPFFFVHGENDFAKLKNLDRYKSENNFIGLSK